MCPVGQLSDPYDQSEDDGIEISLAGLPDEPDEPELPEGVGDVDDVEAVDADTDDGDTDDGDEADPDDADEVGDGDETEDDTDPGDAELAYDLAEWDNERLDALFAALQHDEIAYVWDGSELFVRAGDEDAVDGLVEQIDAEADADGGGQLLGDLFVTADQLQHDPEAHESVARLLKLADAADAAGTPYGLDQKVWQGLHEKVTALAALLEDEKPDGDEVIAAAGELRLAVRPYV
jgi:hypothetical protein